MKNILTLCLIVIANISYCQTQENKIIALTYKIDKNQLIVYHPTSKKILKRNPFKVDKMQLIIYKGNPTMELWQVVDSSDGYIIGTFEIIGKSETQGLNCIYRSAGNNGEKAFVKISPTGDTKTITVDWIERSSKTIYNVSELDF